MMGVLQVAGLGLGRCIKASAMGSGRAETGNGLAQRGRPGSGGPAGGGSAVRKSSSGV
jgi:hypothetical protein